MKEKDLIEQYRQQVAKSQPNIPEGIWESISDQLDIDEVWDRIATELDSENRAISVWNYLAWAASIILILGISGATYWFTTNSKVLSPEIISQQNSESNIIDSTINSIPQKISSSIKNNSPIKEEHSITIPNREGSSNNADLNKYGKNNNSAFSLDKHNNPYSTKRIDAPKQLIAKDKIAYSQPTITPIPVLLQPTNERLQTSDREKSSRYKSLSIGVTSAIKNTWLWGHETFYGFNRNSFTKPGIKVYPDLGLSVMYGITPKISLEASIFIKSQTGQSYKEYLYGHYCDKDISLQYTQLELLAKYNYSKIDLKSSTYRLSITLGFYLSTLTSASETIAGEKQKVSERYSSKDYGLILGQDLEIMLNSRVTVAPGFRLKWGLPNVYAGEQNIPASLKETHNRSLEFRLSVYYNILR